jgi:hypothetical protein
MSRISQETLEVYRSFAFENKMCSGRLEEVQEILGKERDWKVLLFSAWPFICPRMLSILDFKQV